MKIKTQHKNIFCLILSLMIILTLITPTYATTSDGGIEIVATYSSDIQPSNGDIFVLTYRKLSGNVTSTIEVDASLVKNVGKIIPMDPDTYVIDSIEYKGTNQDIIVSGYASNERVRAGHSVAGTLRILVGFTAMKNYSKSYQDDFVVDEVTFYDYDKMNELGKITPQWYMDTGTEITPEVYEYFMSLDTGDPGPDDYSDYEEPPVSSEIPSETPSTQPSEQQPWEVSPSVPENNGGEIVVVPNEPEPSTEMPVEKNNSIQMVALFGGALVVVIGTVIILKKKNII